MSCNTCAKPYSLFRKEKACPGCGFGYCSKCLDNKVFVNKLQSEAHVCVKCSRSQNNGTNHIQPPDAYYKRIEKIAIQPSNINSSGVSVTTSHPSDHHILERLNKLKEKRLVPNPTSNEEITRRLKNIKGEVPSASNEEIQERLSKLRGVLTFQSQPVIASPDLRTEQEQAEDLLKKCLEETEIDSKYKEEFDGVILGIESRLNKLKSSDGSSRTNDQKEAAQSRKDSESEDDENAVTKIVAKV